jgi:hypothetical protein
VRVGWSVALAAMVYQELTLTHGESDRQFRLPFTAVLRLQTLLAGVSSPPYRPWTQLWGKYKKSVKQDNR